MPENIRLKVTKAKLSNIYKRLDSTKPAYTVTGSGVVALICTIGKKIER